MFGREIIYEAEFEIAAARFGGPEALDQLLSPIMDALMREPTGFPIVEAPWGTVRYIHTKAISNIPALIWFFCIDENGNVVMHGIEEFDR